LRIRLKRGKGAPQFADINKKNYFNKMFLGGGLDSFFSILFSFQGGFFVICVDFGNFKYCGTDESHSMLHLLDFFGFKDGHYPTEIYYS